MITIRALGGAGEDSRNCFLITFDEGSIMLDCGVRREIADANVVYPLFDQSIVSKLKAVYLSHCHEDHSAALPYLYHLGYRGKVYASKETISLTPSFLNSWQEYVLKHKGTLPFDPKETENVQFEEINSNSPYLIKYGRSGHVLGGLWYLFEIEGKTILFTGDLSLDSLTLEADPLPEADVLIIDSAYAGRHLNQNNQYQNLFNSVKHTLENNGTVLLPVPANGRGIDIYLYLKQFDLPILLEENILKSTHNLMEEKDWLRESDLLTHDNPSLTVVTNENRESVDLTGKVIITPDGMLTKRKALSYFDRLKFNSQNKVIITGHSAIGTMARNLQDKAYRQQHNIDLEVENITIKVHLDTDDVLSLVKQVKPEKVVLFHTKQENCEDLKNQLISQQIEVLNNIRDTLKL